MSGVVLVPEGPDAGLLWHRGDPFAEERAIAAGQAIVALTNRQVLTVTGDDRLGWLHSLSTGRFDGLTPGRGLNALILSPTGQVRYGLQAVDDGERLWVITDPASSASPDDPAEPAPAIGVPTGLDVQGVGLAEFLDSMRFRMKVQVSPRDDARVLWVGEGIDPADLPAALAPAVDAPLGHGQLVIVAADDVPSPDNPRLAGVWAWEAARVAAGVPRIGIDTDDKTLPNELGLYATELDKGCYTGQETVARVHNVGRPPRRLVRLLLDGSMNRLPAPGDPILLDGEPVGVVGSSAQHFEEGPIALGLVRRAVPVEATLSVDDIAANQEPIVDPDIGLHVKPEPGLRRRLI
ncbi:YgfZ/GcvT domain-containing protein [Propionibacterium freudenreichii]|uniref:CAF17-like 4Fe-4S cluster assembly/insertion protein YgfZ n=1 Tax=Propionibacterium freudenreichii TaxID=1744 RepID=UPI0005A5CC3A|nr:folate-binding protein YgfZ [Propionibacterium freudenreichii]MDK9319238.1 folate-binding protein YgfZ [Propionibacterium freudenreichii]CEI31770.1 glycine cleavage T-protein, aminomethyl transferase [Propionibacterium freudenreichii]